MQEISILIRRPAARLASLWLPTKNSLEASPTRPIISFWFPILRRPVRAASHPLQFHVVKMIHSATVSTFLFAASRASFFILPVALETPLQTRQHNTLVSHNIATWLLRTIMSKSCSESISFLRGWSKQLAKELPSIVHGRLVTKYVLMAQRDRYLQSPLGHPFKLNGQLIWLFSQRISWAKDSPALLGVIDWHINVICSKVSLPASSTS